MFVTAWSTIKKDKMVLVASTSKTRKGKKGIKKKSSSSKGKQVSKPLGGIKKKTNNKEDKYFYYGEVGHWKRNCKKYLASLKNVMFYVKVILSINNDVWVFDSACGSHLCKSLQEMQRAKKLSKYPRIGNGARVDTEASGLVTLACNNQKLELKDYLFLPSLLKNIISIPVWVLALLVALFYIHFEFRLVLVWSLIGKNRVFLHSFLICCFYFVFYRSLVLFVVLPDDFNVCRE